MGAFRPAFLLGIALICLRGGEVYAAAHLTLKEVVQKVVLTNPEVLAKWHTFKAAGGEVDVARSGMYPKIDFSTGIGRETLKQPGSTDRDYSRGGYTLTLNQILYDGYATSSDVKRLDKARLTRYFELLDAAENAALEAARAYYDVIRYRLLMFLAENNYVEHRSSYEQLLRRAQSGAGRRVDVEHAASRVALAELNLTTEAANLHDVMARYMRLVGDRPPPVMFGPALLAKKFPVNEQDALKLAFKRNPALRAAIENVESAHYDLEVRRSAFQPRLDLRMRSENNGNYLGAGGARENNVAEIVLSYNLFNGGADTARQRVFVDRKSLARDLRDKSCRDIRQTLSIAYNDVKRLKAQLTSLGLQVSSIEKTREAYKAQFNIGQRSLLDLLDTENELLNARRTEVNADVDIALAYFRTQAGMGRLLEYLGLKRIDEQEKPDESEFTTLAESEFCPPEAPKSYLVDIEALNARAMAILDTSKTAPNPLSESRPTAAGDLNAVVDLSSPPPMPTLELSRPAKAKALAASKSADTPKSSAERMAIERPTQAAPPVSGLKVEIAERIKAWAAAWSARSYADYAAFYSPTFQPSDGSSRRTWAAQRELRLAIPSSIQVLVGNISFSEETKDSVVAEFDQRYTSDQYSDHTLKTLKWMKVDGRWLIESEAARKISIGAPTALETGK